MKDESSGKIFKTRRADKLTSVTLGLVISAIGLGYSIYRDFRQEVFGRIQHCEQQALGDRKSLGQHERLPAHEVQWQRFKFLKEKVDACCPYRRD